jgi:hypothetical protein
MGKCSSTSSRAVRGYSNEAIKQAPKSEAVKKADRPPVSLRDVEDGDPI